MATTAALPGVLHHLITALSSDLPLHPFPRLISRPGNLLKRLVEGKIVTDRVLNDVSKVVSARLWVGYQPASQRAADADSTHSST